MSSLYGMSQPTAWPTAQRPPAQRQNVGDLSHSAPYGSCFMANSSSFKMFIQRVLASHCSEVVEAVEVIKAAEVSDAREITQYVKRK